MLFLETSARTWLLLHAILGASTVALATHVVVWVLKRRYQSLRWFATVGLALYALQFALGNLIYPTYKVRVRAEYLDLPSAQAADFDARREARLLVERRVGTTPGPDEPPRSATISSAGRLFDVKEHWAALGLAVSIALFAVAWSWRPERDGEGARGLLVGLATLQAGCAWIAGVIGVLVSSVRAIG